MRNHPEHEAPVELLRETVRNAIINTRYYAEKFQDCDADIGSLEDFQKLPILTRRTFENNALEIAATRDAPDFVLVHAGSTSEELKWTPILHFRSEREREVIRTLGQRLNRDAGDPVPLQLRIINANHGMDLMGGRAGVFALPLENDFHLRTLLRVLQTAFPFPGFTERIQLLSGAAYALQILTLLCLENNLCADAFAVRTLTSHSWRLSRRWRQLFQDYWHGAEIDDAYGVSEVAGLFARRCRFCQHFHFSRLAFVEVLDLKTSGPSQTRIGRLVATSLWPLAEVQPLIRYDTGDIVEDHGCCPDTKRHSFEFLGRCHHIIWSDKDEPLLTSMQIEEAVDDFPDIAIEPMAVCAQLNLRQPVGWKKYAVHRSAKHGTITISLDIELRWPPSQYPAKAAEFTSCVQNSLLANAPLLKQHHSEGLARLEITLRAPGTTRHCALR